MRSVYVSCLDVDGKLLAGSEGVILDLLLGDALKVAALLLVGWRERKESALWSKRFGTAYRWAPTLTSWDRTALPCSSPSCGPSPPATETGLGRALVTTKSSPYKGQRIHLPEVFLTFPGMLLVLEAGSLVLGRTKMVKVSSMESKKWAIG